MEGKAQKDYRTITNKLAQLDIV